MSKLADYPFEMRPLSADEGGGYLISFTDFAECLSDGRTVDEAIVNGRDALKATIAALKSRSPLRVSGAKRAGAKPNAQPEKAWRTDGPAALARYWQPAITAY